MKANIVKAFFLERQRGHWRGIDSRKLPSAEKSFWVNENLNEDFFFCRIAFFFREGNLNTYAKFYLLR